MLLAAGAILNLSVIAGSRKTASRRARRCPFPIPATTPCNSLEHFVQVSFRAREIVAEVDFVVVQTPQADGS